MAGLVVLFIILGCGAFQFFKSTIFKAVLTTIVAILACVVAFGYFELVSAFMLGKMASDSKYLPWAQPVAFLMLFVLSFAILQTVAMQLAKEEVDFGDLPEKIGRPIIGVIMGVIVSGFLLTALAMAPLPNKYPYQRFDPKKPDIESPTKVLLNVDGFASGWFGLLSNGSMSAISNPQSFSALHPDFLDQLYLNRLNDSDDIPLTGKAAAISVPSKEGIWYVSGSMKDSQGGAITPNTGCGIVVARISVSARHLKVAGKFTLGQLRLICMPKDAGQNALAGTGVNAYPIGYFSGEDEITTRQLSDLITISRNNFAENQGKIDIDFAFNVPNDYAPVAMQFKQNCIYKVARPVSSDQAPAVSPFVEKAEKDATSETSDTTPSAGGANSQPQSKGNSGSGTRGQKTALNLVTNVVTDESDQ